MFNVLTILLIVVGLLGLVAAAAFFGVGRGLYSLYRQKMTRGYLEQAKKARRENREVEAVKLLLKAERNWRFNFNDTRAPSLKRDLQLYEQIARNIFELVGLKSGAALQDVEGILHEMREFLNDHPRFSADPAQADAELLTTWNIMRGRLESIREGVRASCQPQI